MSEQPIYEVEIRIRSGRPLLVRQVTAERAQEIIQSMYAAWGVPFPSSLSDTPAAFAARLAATGTYFHAEGHASTSVKRGI